MIVRRPNVITASLMWDIWGSHARMYLQGISRGVWELFFIISKESLIASLLITKTYLFKYIENFTTKKWNFAHKKSDIFIFLLKT